MSDSWDRREFIKRLGLAGAGAAGSVTVGLMAVEREQAVVDEPSVPPIPDFRQGLGGLPGDVAVGEGEPAAATRAAIDALGGISRFVKSGERVVIKPNIAWDRTPIQAANTHPAVVASLVRQCLEAGAARVVVTDNSCNEARRCFTRSGIWKAVEQAGGEIVLPDPHRFSPRDIGGVVGTVPVLLPAVEADRFINVAIAKHHSLSKFTGAMKNLYGVIGGRRNRHHQQIDGSIAALTAAILPTLSVVDATRVLLRNGPQGGDVSDTREVGQVFASVDPVALDARACALIGLVPADLPYLAMAEAQGLGRIDASSAEREETA